MTKAPIADAFEEGRQAWRDRAFVGDNPYETLSGEFLAWLVGWGIEKESDVTLAPNDTGSK
jgi:hypothetical protein